MMTKAHSPIQGTGGGGVPGVRLAAQCGGPHTGPHCAADLRRRAYQGGCRLPAVRRLTQGAVCWTPAKMLTESPVRALKAHQGHKDLPLQGDWALRCSIVDGFIAVFSALILHCQLGSDLQHEVGGQQLLENTDMFALCSNCPTAPGGGEISMCCCWETPPLLNPSS